MVDLHLHSSYSDGKQSVQELIDQAIASGVTLLSITDHDTTDHIAEVKNLGTQAGISIVPGVEITTAKQNKGIHLLAHGIAEDNEDISKLLGHLREGRKKGVIEKLEEVNQNFKSLGKPQIDIDALIKSLKHFAFPNVSNYFIEHGFATSKDEAWQYLKGMKARSDDVYPEIVIDIIHKAGGVATLAHPFAPRISLRNITDNSTDLRSLCQDLRNAGLDGIEVYTPAHQEEDIMFAETIARELGLFATIGSDWHGPIESTGENIFEFIPRYPKNYKDTFENIPTEVVSRLIDRFQILVQK